MGNPAGHRYAVQVALPSVPRDVGRLIFARRPGAQSGVLATGRERGARSGLQTKDR